MGEHGRQLGAGEPAVVAGSLGQLLSRREDIDGTVEVPAFVPADRDALERLDRELERQQTRDTPRDAKERSNSEKETKEFPRDPRRPRDVSGTPS